MPTKPQLLQLHQQAGLPKRASQQEHASVHVHQPENGGQSEFGCCNTHLHEAPKSSTLALSCPGTLPNGSLMLWVACGT